MSCSEIMKEPEFNPAEFAYEESLVGEFQTIKQELNQSKLLSEANGNIHSLIVVGNRILDRAVDYIIQVNYMSLPSNIQARRAHMAEQLIEQLQQSFEIGNNAMSAALKNRVDLEVAEIKAKAEAQQERRAIGFGRDQSSESFHGEEVQKQPIGFRTPSKESESSVDPVEKQPIGFGTKTESQISESVKKLVEYAETRESLEKGPMGFVPLKGGSREVVEKTPIGFIHFKAPSEKISEAKLHKILFDIETGVFEFQKGEP